MATRDWIDEVLEPLPDLLTADDCRRLLRCSRRSVARRIATGRLTAIREIETGGARVLIPKPAMRSYLRGLAVR